MWIQVRTVDGKKTVRIDSLSKLTKIEDLRKRLVEDFDAEPSDQRLFFRGKQLEDGYTLFDYDVGLNDLIQLMIRIKLAPESTNQESTEQAADKSKTKDGAEENFSDKENKEPDSDEEFSQGPSGIVCLDQDEGNIYKVGDIIDARDPLLGAWFEANIIEVYRDRSSVHHQKPLRLSSSAHPSTSNIDAESRQEAVLGSEDSVESETSTQEMVDTKDSSASNCENTDTALKEKSDKDDCGNNCDQENETVITDENCNTPTKRDVPVKMDNEKSLEVDEPDAGGSQGVQKMESVSVLTPKRVSTSKENTAESGNTPASRSLFVKEVSDDLKKQGILCETIVTDGFIYKVRFDGYEEEETVELSSKHIRPRARHCLAFENVKEGQTIMANYNYEDARSRGFWYDCLVTKKKNTRTQKELYATVYIGTELMALENCRLLFLNELFDIEKPGTQLTEQDLQLDPSASPAKRQNKPECDFCKDNPRRNCKHCACCECGGKHEPEKQLICDECEQAYHLGCLDPPLLTVPEEDDWYCPKCKRDENEVVKAGEKLKESKKKSKMASATSSSSRDWGKGMACVGRTKQCTIVPSNHYGPIPGVEVGTMWKFRVQVSEAGVHRPHVAGIHGREDDGAFSIVLSGGYEDDADNGDEFYYTGSGGRDLSGNKRTAEQSCDQKLTRMNKALAKNCNVAINSKNGAEASDWKGGKPVRVVRNCKGRKHSKYAPEEGNRYDGIYKIVKYWAEKGKSGFLVWRYLLRRDDPAPAPWTKEGKKRIEQLGLTMQYPEGYLESQAEKEKEKTKASTSDESEEDPTPKKRGRKRKAESPPVEKEKKKAKTVGYTVEKEVLKLIREDTVNQKLWNDALEHTSEGKQKFLQHLEDLFMCICCQEILYKPVTLQCSHNFCKPCIKRSFKAEVYSCPACRTELPKDMPMTPNAPLTKVLNHFYPGYEAGRE
ncbi:E3 ubiquitin-protein ligase UHRF1-like [Babylonia areolata]|uniref:E3 ubiquitin-protein ligase UHRF1-like n=1 Tax=Babylonia areolata TaxID=304850 RepID=UPI003FD034A8